MARINFKTTSPEWMRWWVKTFINALPSLSHCFMVATIGLSWTTLTTFIALMYNDKKKQTTGIYHNSDLCILSVAKNNWSFEISVEHRTWITVTNWRQSNLWSVQQKPFQQHLNHYKFIKDNIQVHFISDFDILNKYTLVKGISSFTLSFCSLIRLALTAKAESKDANVIVTNWFIEA